MKKAKDENLHESRIGEALDGITTKDGAPIKMTVTAKCHPEIKRATIEAADKRGMTVSEYVECVLGNYEDIFQELQEMKDDNALIKKGAEQERDRFTKQLAEMEERDLKNKERFEQERVEFSDQLKENESLKIKADEKQRKWELERLESTFKINQVITASQLKLDTWKEEQVQLRTPESLLQEEPPIADAIKLRLPSNEGLFAFFDMT